MRTGETLTPPAPAEETYAQPSPVTARHGWRCVACPRFWPYQALAIGAIPSIVVRWRRPYDRFKHWTMRWPIR